MKHIYCLLAILLSFSAGGCAAPHTVTVGGDEAVVTGFILPIKETFEEETKIPLVVSHIKPGDELIQLEKGKLDAVVSANDLKDLLQEARLKKVAVQPASLHQVQVGQNRMVIFLHKKNKVTKLSQKQLKSIFTGKVKNWHQLGGSDQEITVIWDASSAAENEVFIKNVLKGAPLLGQFRSADSAEKVRKLVLESPGAIGIAPSGFIAPGIKVPQAPKMTSPVILVTKGAPSPLVSKLVDILKDAAYMQ